MEILKFIPIQICNKIIYNILYLLLDIQMFNQQFENITPRFCEKCGAQYGPDDVLIVPEYSQQVGQTLNIRCSCSKCRNVVVMKLAFRPGGGVSGFKDSGKSYEDEFEAPNTEQSVLTMEDLLIFYELLQNCTPKTLIAQGNDSKVS